MINDENTTKRLDVLIRLLLEQQLKDGKMKRNEQLTLLDSAGLTSGEIGKILGQPSKNIASQLNTLRKKKVSKKKKDENGTK